MLLVDIYFRPKRAFEDLRDAPTFVAPIVYLWIACTTLAFVYSLNVDSVWYAAQDPAPHAGNPSFINFTKTPPNIHARAIASVIIEPIVCTIASALSALYILALARILGHSPSFRQTFSLSVWASMPALLGVVIAVLAACFMAPQTPIEALALTNIDQIVKHTLGPDAGSFLLRGVDLVDLWIAVLLGVGWRGFMRSSRAEAVLFATLTTCLSYVIGFGLLTLFS